MNKENDKSDINLLFELGSLRFMKRMWQRFLNDDFANLAEHHFRMFWIAMVIAAHEENVDTGKLAKMVLVHDIAESRAGDVDYLARQYVVRNEELGIKDMLAGTSIEGEFLGLWEEYEKNESIEAKIAKDADNLDVDFELAERAAKGSKLKEQWTDMREYVVREKLHTETAKHLREQLTDANPHEWHLMGRNRHNGGDWKG